jgi:putative transposase
MINPNYKPFYRRNLPHVHPRKARYFVTFRLANSLPVNVVESLRQEFKEFLANENSTFNSAALSQFHEYFNAFDQLLDESQRGARWLSDPKVAEYVAEALRFHDGRSYTMLCWTIMPNHIHCLFDHDIDSGTPPIHLIVQSIKKYSARRANLYLERTGKKFWQNESYDHVVKDDTETENVIRYILENPVKAKLCKNWCDWKWTYLRDEFKHSYLT